MAKRKNKLFDCRRTIYPNMFMSPIHKSPGSDNLIQDALDEEK